MIMARHWTILAFGICAIAFPSNAGAQTRGKQATDSTVLLLDEIVVSATRTGRTVRELPANVTVINRAQIQVSAAGTLPDLLRSIPGFTMADYQSSIAANPSRQSPAMRGLGGTSASRALVMVDGVPLNDPFTGWVSWSRIPLDLVERVEVVRGGSAGIWGNRAMGGVINVITSNPAANRTRLSARTGSGATAGANAALTRLAGPLTITAAGEYFDTDGFFVVPASLRGTVDIRSGLSYATGYARLRYDASPALSLEMGGDWFDEKRRNATQLARINTTIGEIDAKARFRSGPDLWSLSIFGVQKEGDQLSTSEADDRNTETPTIGQYDVPARSIGINLQWSRAIASGHELTAGADVLAVNGELNERSRWVDTAFTRQRHASGNQLDRSVYVQDVFTPARDWRLFAAGRFDRWRNRDGRRSELDLVSGAIRSDTAYAAQSESRFSYTLAVHHDLTDRFSWRGSVYSSFRAPTLNELYRPARASGNVLIEPQPHLESESLNGGELGIDFAPDRTILARVTGYWTRLSNPIIDVTLGEALGGSRNIPPCGSVPAGGACRQRGNLGTARTMGIETDIELRPHPEWTLSLSHVWGSTEVTRAPDQEQLVGKTFVGLADHVMTARVRHVSARMGDISITGRYVGERFDDDQNTLVLDPFLVLDAHASRPVSARWEVFGSIENAFDKAYAINKAPDGSYRIAAPRRLEVGVRGHWQ